MLILESRCCRMSSGRWSRNTNSASFTPVTRFRSRSFRFLTAWTGRSRCGMCRRFFFAGRTGPPQTLAPLPIFSSAIIIHGWFFKKPAVGVDVGRFSMDLRRVLFTDESLVINAMVELMRWMSQYVMKPCKRHTRFYLPPSHLLSP